MKKKMKRAVGVTNKVVLEKVKPGIFYSPVNALPANGSVRKTEIQLSSDSTGQLAVSAPRQVSCAMLQKLAIAMPVTLGTPIKGLSVYYQIVYPAGVRNSTRTYIVNPALVEHNATSHTSVDLLNDVNQLNQTAPTTYTSVVGIPANKTAQGPLTCVLQICIGDPADVILIAGVKLITG